MRRDGVWFHDRGWPTGPLNPPGRRRSGRVALGPGSAALFIHQRLRAFGYTLNVNRAARPLGVISGHAQHASIRPRCTGRRRIDRPAPGTTRYDALNIWPVMQRKRLPSGDTAALGTLAMPPDLRGTGTGVQRLGFNAQIRKWFPRIRCRGYFFVLCIFLMRHWLERY